MNSYPGYSDQVYENNNTLLPGAMECTAMNGHPGKRRRCEEVTDQGETNQVPINGEKAAAS